LPAKIASRISSRTFCSASAMVLGMSITIGSLR
jgi:hypothetical protein